MQEAKKSASIEMPLKEEAIKPQEEHTETILEEIVVEPIEENTITVEIVEDTTDAILDTIEVSKPRRAKKRETTVED